jgi:predicted anti-sigma-YlaC factor YlaD
MDTSKYDAWIKKIFSTEAVEISCSDCLDLLPVYVDSQIDGVHRSEHESLLNQHLDQCKACRDEYEMLRELSLLDSEK